VKTRQMILVFLVMILVFATSTRAQMKRVQRKPPLSLCTRSVALFTPSMNAITTAENGGSLTCTVTNVTESPLQISISLYSASVATNNLERDGNLFSLPSGDLAKSSVPIGLSSTAFGTVYCKIVVCGTTDPNSVRVSLQAYAPNGSIQAAVDGH
jgi:hypothetical protein